MNHLKENNIFFKSTSEGLGDPEKKLEELYYLPAIRL